MEENKYKDALSRAKSAIKECGDNVGRIKMIESIFSDELWESEEEQTRKQLLDFVQRYTLASYADRDKWVAYLEKLKDIDKRLEDAYKTADEVQYKRGYEDGYLEGIANAKNELEKQGEMDIEMDIEKPITIGKRRAVSGKLKELIEETKEKMLAETAPKFKVGDWVVCEVTNSVYQIKNCIENLSNHKYGYDLTNGGYIGSDEVNHYHLWTIQDAKDGDVLVASDDSIFIYAGSTDRHAKFYVALTKCDTFNLEGGNWEDKNRVHPATKEQRELLFKKMEENGYALNPTTKELSHKEMTKKSEQDSKLSEEDEDVIYALETILDILIDPEAGIGLDEVKGVKNETMKSWLKSLKDRVQPQPKQKWTKEDENGFGDTLWAIKQARTIAKDENDMGNLWYAENWIKELKERIGG